MQAPRFLLPRELSSSTQGRQRRRTTSLDAPLDQVAAILPHETMLEPEGMTMTVCLDRDRKPSYMNQRRSSDSSTDSLGQASMSSAVSACSSLLETTSILSASTSSSTATSPTRSCLKKSLSQRLLAEEDVIDIDLLPVDNSSTRSSAMDKTVRFNDHVVVHTVRVRSYLQRRLHHQGRTLA